MSKPSGRPAEIGFCDEVEQVRVDGDELDRDAICGNCGHARCWHPTGSRGRELALRGQGCIGDVSGKRCAKRCTRFLLVNPHLEAASELESLDPPRRCEHHYCRQLRAAEFEAMGRPLSADDAHDQVVRCRIRVELCELQRAPSGCLHQVVTVCTNGVVVCERCGVELEPAGEVSS